MNDRVNKPMRATRRGDDDAELPLSPTRRVDDDVRNETEFHIQERAAELEAAGMSRERALAEARLLFGDRESIESECKTIERRRRQTKGRAFRARSFRQDLIVGLRMLRKTPGFTAMAIVTLALGIGANAAVFSLVNQAILQPLDYDGADRLVTIVERHENGFGTLAWSTFTEVEHDARSFDAMASYAAFNSTVLGATQPLRVQTAIVSHGFFGTFALKPEKGRLPAADEHREGGRPVVVVSHAFWEDKLGAPASLDGVKLKLDEQYDVIGVLPPGFGFPDEAEIWVPLERQGQSTSHTAHNWEVIGRLRPGVSATNAERELSDLLARMRPKYAPDFDATGATVKSLQETQIADIKTPLYLLFAASSVLLLAACTNVASAQLARGTARATELAVRSALGAARLRLVRQLLTESLMLATLGAVSGIALAWLLLRGFRMVAPAELHIERVSIDGWVMLFAAVVAVVTAVAFGLYPAMRLSETNTSLALRHGGTSTGSRTGMRVWNTLVAAEIALAVMLLAGSAVLVRSFAQVMSVDLGFDPAHVTTVQVELPSVNYPDSSAATPRFHEELLSHLRRNPSVTAAGFANRLPLEGANPSGGMMVEGKPPGPDGRPNGYAVYRVVGGDYFKALGIRIIEGRALGPGDDAGAPRVVVVNEKLAREQWPNGSAIGRRVRPEGMDMRNDQWFTVVGVVANTRAEAVTAPYRETYYFDHRQRPSRRTSAVSYVVRTPLAPSAAATLVRNEVRNVDAQVPVETGSMSRVLARAVADRRFMMVLLAAFASTAILLALVGIYAVVSYTVAQRTREIGVRLALGATPGQVRGLVLRSAMAGVIPGLAAGTVLALLGVNTLRSLLYGVSPQDPVALVSAITLLGLVGVLSTLLPARRATRVDPLIAMRAE